MKINPVLKKAQKVSGKSLVFRDAKVTDAQFILSLRTDEKKSEFLSKVSNDLAAQVSWLDNYSKTSDQIYFIIEYQNKAIGTVRIYDQKDESFCWGSWILSNERPSHAAMESALMIYSYCTDHLKFSQSHFEVRKGNERVWKFHERFGARRIAEDEMNYYYLMDMDAIASSRLRYQRFLENNVEVVHL